MSHVDLLESVTAAISSLLALSVAVERALTLLKSLVPWLARDGRAGAHRHERLRVVAVHAAAIALSWLCCTSFLDSPGLLDRVLVGGLRIPTWMFVLLGTGGSALWNDVLGMTRALKVNSRGARTSAGDGAGDGAHLG